MPRLNGAYVLAPAPNLEGGSVSDIETPIGSISLFPEFAVTSDDVVADIGCGAGESCVRAGSVGATVIAVDIQEDTLRFVENRMREVPARSFRAILANSDLIPLESGVASAVICTEVLEHVGDPEVFMAELVRIGRRGARYMLSVPDFLSDSLLKAVSPASAYQAPNHVRIFDRAQFRELARRHGLVITDTKFVGFYWSIWWFLRFVAGTEYTPGAPGDVPEVLCLWQACWDAALKTPQGDKIAAKLDPVLPKSQVILAVKPVLAQEAEL